MIEAEKAKIEKIKEKQQKEVEKMLQAEFVRQEIEAKNEEKKILE